MHQVWPVALVVATVLAGCNDGGGKADDVASGFDDLDVAATSTTGIILGIVVDDRIIPVANADVGLRGGTDNKSASTDKEGRFTFAGLAPGTYFLTARHVLHLEAQTAVEVRAGVEDPPVTKLQLTRRFSQEPFVEQYKHDGFIQCNQSGVYYGSAPCITDFTGIVTGNGVVPPGCTPAGCAPQLRQIQDENRGFTVTLGPGWQALVWEMVWEETSPTFDTMGITVSYNATQRPASHNYASYGSASPLRMQVDVGEDFEPSNSVEPELIPPEGLPDLYYFVGVRNGPAVAVNQPFQLFAHFFYYSVPPEGWSFVAEDPLPF